MCWWRLLPSQDSICLSCVGEEPQAEPPWLLAHQYQPRTSKAPAFTHLSLPVLCQFQQWGMPWSWNRHKIQMNQCPISHVLCLQARWSNYHPTRCPCWPSRTNRRSKSITAIRVRFICDGSGSSAQAPLTGALHTPQHSFRTGSLHKGEGEDKDLGWCV